jgi:hypothetical protein
MAEYRIVGPVPITYAVAPPAVGKGSGLLKEHHRPALLPQTVAVFFFRKAHFSSVTSRHRRGQAG